MKILITGGCGFLGSNLAAATLTENDELCVFDDLSRSGSTDNLAWLETLGEFQFIKGDVSNANDINRVVAEFRPDAVYHLAGQVAMTTSISDPRRDFEINAFGSFNLLEAVRAHAPDAVVIYSSTNKVYGDLEWTPFEETESRYLTPDFPNGFPEQIPMEFHSPYGCSKGAADQYMLDYARMFGLRTIVFRHSSMYGARQFATFDQGWVGWFCRQALEAKAGRLSEPFTIAGNGKQVRDLLHAHDLVRLYRLAIVKADAGTGHAFNIGGGMENSLSLLELFALLEELEEVTLDFRRLEPRESDQKVFVADNTKVRQIFGWEPLTSARTGISSMLDWSKDISA
jgi:CDP-paratose 2-epimerase